jgi:PAS domain S-box-containing protein
MLAFVAATVLLGAGAFYIFSSLNASATMVSNEINYSRRYADLRASLREFTDNVRGWALSGKEQYREGYDRSLSDVYKNFGMIQELVGPGEDIKSIGREFEEIRIESDRILNMPAPVSNKIVFGELKDIMERKDAILARMDKLYEISMGSLVRLVSVSERIRANAGFYLFALVCMVSSSFIFLVLFMRRMLSEPFNEMLQATEKVAGGDLSYRISSPRKDEVGLIAGRFDSMVQRMEESTNKVRDKLRETELLLDVSRIAAMTPELKEALSPMMDAIAEKLEKEVCSLYLLKPERNAFQLEASSGGEAPREAEIPVDSPLSRMILETMKPLIVPDTGTLQAGVGELCSFCKSLLVAPVLRDSACKGLLVLGRSLPGGFKPDEKDTVMILAHTIGVAVRNAELYTTTRKQLHQLSVMYDLSKTLTMLYSPEELLKRVSTEIAKLTGAKICIIRLLEEGKLEIKSTYGITEDAIKDLSLPDGSGIPEWVLKEGKSLFVEDVTRLPERLKHQTLEAKSAICVPLKLGEKIIGTLALYDRTVQGASVSFELDDLSIAEGFASILAIAIDKARVEQQERDRRQEVFEANKRLDLLFETVQGGIISLNSDYSVLAANRYVERWVDQPLDKVIGRNAKDVFHPKGGICPHCAARTTFETGEINSITQSSGLNYAELTAYPVRDGDGRIGEVVIFIQDITDRILYQEEIMGLYREVAQTKEYLESLINNSADAIVTSDITGVVTTWNRSAEEIYGYNESEVVGKFLPFIPEFLLEQEKQYMERLKQGDVIKTETLRVRKDGEVIEVSLTLSPIKDAAGEVVGISGITRDITQRKRVERELIRRNQELSRLFFISSAMRGTLEVEKLLRMILTAVTMSDGLGFNRAGLFLVDGEKKVLRGAMGVGPASPDEAGRIWQGLSLNQKTLHDVISDMEESPLKKESFFDRLTTGLEIPLEQETILTRAVKEKKPFNVLESSSEPLVDPVLIQQFGTQAYAVVPLVSRNRAIGVLWVDNLFNRKPITEEDMKFLSAFSNQMASAVENARLFEQMSMAEAELENIFRSISDMVYITDRDFTIRKVNDAVLRRVGKPLHDVVGRKCFEVFHGAGEPMPSCPHLKTVETRKSNVEEYDDPYLNATFLSSTSPLSDAEGNFLGIVHVVRDITEMKALRERLQNTERMAALGEVAAKVAHEIRNPLVSIGGFAKRLEKKLDGNPKEYAGIISGEVTRLEQILKEILGFVKEARIARERIDLKDLVEGVSNLMEHETSEKGNTIRKELETVPVFVDPNRMKEAIFNIVTNANQATDGGVITLRTYKKAEEAVMEVTDTGVGIKREDIPRIFDPFYTTRPMGTGLGLAIAKRIVEEHGGRISVSSKIPGGTVFKIYLSSKEAA